MASQFLSTLNTQLKQYFRLTPYLEDEALAKQSIIDGVSFRGPNILILILAIFVASLGLNTNSAAVIIGAMLISPLMGPIIGIGLGAGIYDFPLIKRSARNLAAAAIFSVAASTLFFLISPVREGHSELLARTSPTIYDVLIGFFGGAAGIVAIACKQKGNVIPGVAIATALMPPLCTAGYGLATWQLQYFTGAFYLFLINSIFISLATLIGVKLFNFKQVTFVDPQRRVRIKRIITWIVVATLLPSVYLTVLMLRESFFVTNANNFVEEQLNFPNTQVFSKDAYIKKWRKHLNITLIGQYVNIDSLKVAMAEQMDKSPWLKGTDINIKQGFSTGMAATAQSRAESLGDVFSTALSQIERQKQSIDSLNQIISARRQMDSISYIISPEIKALYPSITFFSFSRSYVCNIDTRKVDTLNLALIESKGRLNDLPKIRQYLEARTGLPNIHIIQTDIPLK
ncbi:MAG: DUF389 domain-containing protein [Clostridium sp.]|nr:DUF389 domain-containing protein [Clostridium sp.]